jgi:hypothetical protein
MSKPRMFIGSSVEGLPIAEAIQEGLEHTVESKIWSQGVFNLSLSTLETLCREVKKSDFAALVLTPDDLVQKRGTAKNAPRDNVLFELGLFMGALGRERTYIIYRQDLPMDLPTDLAGITAATFLGRTDENLQAAVGPACSKIKRAIREVFSAGAATSPSVQPSPAELIASLQQELASQNTKIRQMLEAVTSDHAIKGQGGSRTAPKIGHDLDFLCGTWKDLANDSIGHAAIVGNELRFLYSFGGFINQPTGEYHSFSLIGDSLFGRFNWFDGSFEGYTYLKIVSKNKLEGGWWISDSPPEEDLMNIEKLKTKNFSVWVRQTNPSDEPTWAKEWLQKLKDM